MVKDVTGYYLIPTVYVIPGYGYGNLNGGGSGEPICVGRRSRTHSRNGDGCSRSVLSLPWIMRGD